MSRCSRPRRAQRGLDVADLGAVVAQEGDQRGCGRKVRLAVGTKFSDYLAESEAADTPEEGAVRAMFAAGVALVLQFRDAGVGQGLTQSELSGLTGIPQADISRIERGAGNPTESTLQRLAHALNGRLQLVTS
jgi:hypothetical protein